MQHFGFYQSMTPQFRGRLKRSLATLTDEQRVELNERYKRHLKACKASDCPPEIMFVFEAIEELVSGRGLEAGEVNNDRQGKLN
jgi:hypothetical protein